MVPAPVTSENTLMSSLCLVLGGLRRMSIQHLRLNFRRCVTRYLASAEDQLAVNEVASMVTRILEEMMLPVCGSLHRVTTNFV